MSRMKRRTFEWRRVEEEAEEVDRGHEVKAAAAVVLDEDEDIYLDNWLIPTVLSLSMYCILYSVFYYKVST